MDADQASAAANAAFDMAQATVARTEDPLERQVALLEFYRCEAEAFAFAQIGDLLVASHLTQADLAARANATADAFVAQLLQNNATCDYTSPGFTDATTRVARETFFQRLNSLIALAAVIPAGIA